jgi:exopolysaccharide production protein ExoQ
VALVLILAAMAYSHGTTSVLASMLTGVAVVRLRWRNWRLGLILYAGLAVAALVLITVALAGPDLLFEALGKDPNMTGRIPLWVEAAHAALERPVLGWGYDVFWSRNSIEAQYIWQRIGWPAPNAHNGPLELALDFGLVGGLLYLFMVARIAWRALLALNDPGFPEAKWLVLVSIAMLVEFIDEGTVGWPNALAMTVGFGSALTSVWRAGHWPVPVRRPMARPTLKSPAKTASRLAP